MRAIVDLDGVLCDFYTHAIVAHDRDPVSLMKTWPQGLYFMAGHLGMSEYDFMKPMGNSEFWATMPWMHDGRGLLAAIEQRFEDVVLWTRPSYVPGCDHGKREWVHTHLPNYDDRLIIGGSKEIAAHSRVVLFDDMDLNIRKFILGGGYGVLVPRIWNGLFPFAAQSLKYVCGRLGDIR